MSQPYLARSLSMNEQSGESQFDRNPQRAGPNQENTISCKADNILDFIDAHPHLGAESKEMPSANPHSSNSGSCIDSRGPKTRPFQC